MTDKLKAAAEMALEALEKAQAYTSSESFSPSMTNELAIRAAHLRLALEQPQTPDDLLRQSEREGWRYAKECAAEAAIAKEAHPPSRACGCEDCKPSFDDSEIGDGFYYAQKLPEKP